MKGKVLDKIIERHPTKVNINELDYKTKLKIVLKRIVNHPSYHIIWLIMVFLSLFEIIFRNYLQSDLFYTIIFFAILSITFLMQLIRYFFVSRYTRSSVLFNTFIWGFILVVQILVFLENK